MQMSQRITRQSASNLALAFVLLPKAKRQGMAALYAFCRQVDDIADDMSLALEERRSRLDAWRSDVRHACAGKPPQFPVNQELQPVIAQYQLPFGYFDELIRGVEMDLDIHRYPNYEALELYCYRVASVVGLLSIEIFGYQDPACRQYAIYLGKALQLTNILRDVRADAERGRIYLPLSELNRFKVSPQEILRLEYSSRFRDLAGSTARQACHFYRLARQTLPEKERRSMMAAELMGAVYWRLLRQLEALQFRVFSSAPARLSRGQKLFLVFRTWLSSASGLLVPRYGA